MVFFFFFLVLKAINEDSPTVPTLLTDYILKGKHVFNHRKCNILIIFRIVLGIRFISDKFV